MISVCLAAFNGEKHIGAQIASILASPRVTELLVSDDGSTDGTRAAIAAVGDPRVKVLAGPGRGVIRNFEFLLGQATGEYLFLSDQDDVWLERKIDTVMQAFGEADLVISDCAIVDDQLQVVTPSFFAARGSGPGFMKNFLRNSFLGCCMAFRREVLDYVLPFPAAIPMHDWWIGLMASRRGRVRFLDEVLVLYRRHGANATYAVVSEASLLQQLSWRLRMLSALLT